MANDQNGDSPKAFTTDAESTGVFEMPSVTKLLNRKSLGLPSKPRPPDAPSEPPPPPSAQIPAPDNLFALQTSPPPPPPPPSPDANSEISLSIMEEIPPPDLVPPAAPADAGPVGEISLEISGSIQPEEGVSQVITLELPEANEPSLIDQIRLHPPNETESPLAEIPPPPPSIAPPPARLRPVMPIAEVRQKIRARTLEISEARESFKTAGSAFEKALIRLAIDGVQGIAILEAGNSAGGGATLLGLKYAASCVLSLEARFTSACEGVQFFPSIAPDLWQSMSKTGCFELPPADTSSAQQPTPNPIRSPRTALRTAFGAKPGDWVTLAMVGAGITARILVILSKRSIAVSLETELPALRSASGMDSSAAGVPPGMKAA